MTEIRSSADLRNRYNDVSTFCHNNQETVFITKNGKGDLAVMSIEHYDYMKARIELYEEILRGVNEAENGKTIDYSDAMTDIRKRRSKGAAQAV